MSDYVPTDLIQFWKAFSRVLSCVLMAIVLFLTYLSIILKRISCASKFLSMFRWVTFLPYHVDCGLKHVTCKEHPGFEKVEIVTWSKERHCSTQARTLIKEMTNNVDFYIYPLNFCAAWFLTFRRFSVMRGLSHR